MTDANFLLRDIVKENVQTHLSNSGTISLRNVYEVILEQIEEPLMQSLMQKAKNNQCTVTRWLGLSRGTVRKLLKKYELID
jgi:Fis family transcriptional regulator